MKPSFLTRTLVGLTLLGLTLPSMAQNITVKNGETVAFLGDSITAGGYSQPLGYVRLVLTALESNGVKVAPIAAGVSGNKSNDMLRRLPGILEKKPQWMTLSCGVNDVWHGERGVALPDYQANITAIVDQATAAGVKVVILTSTLIKEDVDGDLNQKAMPYNDFLRTLAKEKNLPLADLNADFRAARAALSEADKKCGNVLTSDGVHMNNIGNEIMAVGVLRAFGLNDDQLKKAKETWLDMPNTTPVVANAGFSLRQYEQLEKAAATQNRTLDQLVTEALKKYLDGLLATPPAK